MESVLPVKDWEMWISLKGILEKSVYDLLLVGQGEWLMEQDLYSTECVWSTEEWKWMVGQNVPQNLHMGQWQTN